ncbi:GTP-binding protein [Shinella yambaruensis]|uniref:Cobalamin biosynthesis protein CobW n=1 Tax=Shinella yambaruensis TaxID=415996 RepID=A0ABQ5ZLR2_9HYPH|nr:GTP-binding protein [Shinella yambaruensis]MCJ8027774.1 GTP-binding protein [Shinella yambaruensis]MCU7983224.1 GTP-binding protein [Shinella yambaruensis]GLR52684.1 cobalamin biosynthesis protein CobW [Shinella yambaruensis]
MADIPAFTPVHLLTGFLGSGKTTLLKRLLADPALADTAVMINEFGAVGLDHHLVERIDDTMVLLQSGCVCCTVRGELAEALRDLHSKRERGLVPPFTRVVIESTGLADPFPVLSTLKSDPVLRHHFRAGSVVTTVDAVNGLAQLDTYVESNRQAAIADRIVVTKADLCPGNAALVRLLSRLAELNPDAVRHIAAADGPGADALFGDDTAQRAARLQSASGFYCDAPAGLVTADGTPHQAAISSFVITVDTPVDWTGFGVWLTMLLNRHGERVLRVKGMLDIAGEDRPVAVHGVQHLVHPPVHMDAWPAGERSSRIVFIVDGLDPNLLKRSFNAFALAGKAADSPQPEAAAPVRNAQSP